MIRRRFFAAIVALFGTSAGKSDALVRVEDMEVEPKSKYVFRKNAKGRWERIVWETMAVGDELIVTEHWGGKIVLTGYKVESIHCVNGEPGFNASNVSNLGFVDLVIVGDPA